MRLSLGRFRARRAIRGSGHHENDPSARIATLFLLPASGTNCPSSLEQAAHPAASPSRSTAIAAVSRLSGISCHTLRVWERRYGFPVPVRSPSGHRRYDRAQVQMLCRLGHLIRADRQPIGELISRMNAGGLDLGELPCPRTRHRPRRNGLGADRPAARRGYRGRGTRLRHALRAVSIHRLWWSELIYPLLVEAGEGWFRGNYSVYQERLITIFLRAKLTELIEAARAAEHPPGAQRDRRDRAGRPARGRGPDVQPRHGATGLEGSQPRRRSAGPRVSSRDRKVARVGPGNLVRPLPEHPEAVPGAGADPGSPGFRGGRSIINYQSLAGATD